MTGRRSVWMGVLLAAWLLASAATATPQATSSPKTSPATVPSPTATPSPSSVPATTPEVPRASASGAPLGSGRCLTTC